MVRLEGERVDMADLEVTTARCSDHGHPEFRLAYNSELVFEDDVRFLVETLEQSVADGARFEDGSTIQIGWMETRVREASDGTLSIQEPDNIHTPIWWIDSINHSLIHRRLQRGVCASVGRQTEIDFPSSLDDAWVCQCFGETDGFEMRRLEVDGPHSVWMFSCDAPGHDHSDTSTCARMQLYEVVVGIEPRVIPYLALPVGTTAVLRAEGPTILADGEPLEVRPGSLLARNFPESGR
jgi:hypothetical protein